MAAHPGLASLPVVALPAAAHAPVRMGPPQIASLRRTLYAGAFVLAAPAVALPDATAHAPVAALPALPAVDMDNDVGTETDNKEETAWVTTFAGTNDDDICLLPSLLMATETTTGKPVVTAHDKNGMMTME